jgi:WD40 repeat protein
VTEEQILSLYQKLDFRYGPLPVEVFGLVGKSVKAGDTGEIYVYDSTTGSLENKIETGHDGSVKRIAARKGDIVVHLITVSSDGTGRVFNFETGKYCRKLIGHEGPVNCVAVSEDEDFRKALVITGGKDCTVRTYYLCSGRPKYKELIGHKFPAQSWLLTLWRLWEGSAWPW